MEEQIRELLARYIKGECTDEEVALLERWYDRITREKESVRLISPADEERLVMELWKNIENTEDQGKYHRRRKMLDRKSVV